MLASQVAVQVSRADFNELAARLFCMGPLSAKLLFNIGRSQAATTHGGEPVGESRCCLYRPRCARMIQ
jgi:hypothetical protein